MNQRNNLDTIEYVGQNRKYYDSKIRLGKKLNILDMTPQLKRHITIRGMSKINLIAQWDNIIGKIYADHCMPDSVKNISGIKTLLCKVRYTRIIEFQHQKFEFIKQINLFAGYEFIDDIRFIRVDNLPKKREYPVPIGLKITNEPHPKLSKISLQCQNEDLKKVFHLLAHVIMPINKGTEKISHKENIEQHNPKTNLLSSWRDRAKIVLNCSDK